MRVALFYIMAELMCGYFRLDAIITTRGIEDIFVIHMNSEGAAMRLWRSELRDGNRIRSTGMDREEEVNAFLWRNTTMANMMHQRILFQDGLRERLLDALVDEASSANSELASPEALQSPLPTQSPINSVNAIGMHKSMQPAVSSESLLWEALSPSEQNEISAVEDHTSGDLLDSTTASQPVMVAELDGHKQPHPKLSRNYAPPDSAGQEYLPDDLPVPLDVKRGTEGKYPWYVAKKSRLPGIYASWYECYF